MNGDPTWQSRDAADVRELLREHMPRLVEEPITLLGRGWDNDSWKIGEDFVLRLPRRVGAVANLLAELAPLRQLPDNLPLSVPRLVHFQDAPIHAQAQEAGQVPWALLEFAPGTPAGDSQYDMVCAARDFGLFLARLHTTVCADPPENPARTGPLARRADTFAERAELVAQSHQVLRPKRIIDVFTAAAQAPEWPLDPVWIHADIHGYNALAHGGRLSAVIDFGDTTVGDPAVDISGAWWLLDPAHHELFWDTYCTAVPYSVAALADTWVRARGWAVGLAVALLAGGDLTPPHMHASALTTLDRLR